MVYPSATLDKAIVAAADRRIAYAALEDLAAAGTALAVSVDPFDPVEWGDFVALARRAGALGVEIVLGPKVVTESGEPDFFCVTSASAACRTLLEAARRSREDGLTIEWMFLDAEPSKSWMQTFLERIRSGGLPEAIRWAKGSREAEKLESAREQITAAVVQAGELGYYVGVTTVPFLLDDAEIGARPFEETMGLAVTGVPWACISFQLYRSLYNGADAARAFGLPAGTFTPYFVYSYSRTAVEHFGERAAVGLGVAGKPAPVVGMGSGFYDRPSELKADVAAAKAAGVERKAQLHIFWLDGMAQSGRLEDWLSAAEAEPKRFDPDPSTDNLRALLKALGEALVES